MGNLHLTSAQGHELISNLATIKGICDDFAIGDFPAFLNAIDPKMEWNEAENFPYADHNPYIGPQAIAEDVLGRIGADWEYFTLSDHEFYETTGDSIIATGRYNAKHKTTGKVIRAQFAHFWWVKNGKSTRFHSIKSNG